MPKASKFITPTDCRSAVWSRVKAQIEDDLKEARSKLELDLNHDQTMHQRGRIAALKQLLEYAPRALAEDPRRRKAPADSESGSLDDTDI